ncbi:MAG: B12-binding domain-containing protein [Candidatus Moduliflexus flocculans]|nr:B12-binding domain-containing protein [Candidatus Moduliflexus flocculans]
MGATIKNIFEAILAGEADTVKVNIQAALDAGLDPNQVLNEGMIAAMREVGQRFEAGDFFVPEMLISARAMQGGMALLKPHLAQGDVKSSSGNVVIGTVKGDLHDIGKNLVSHDARRRRVRGAWTSAPT